MRKYIIILYLLFFGVTTMSGQLTQYDFPAMRWNTNHGLKSNSLTDIDVDNRGIIWVSTNEGLYRNQGASLQNINTIIENSPFDDPIEVFQLYIDNQDRIWIGSVENGLLMYDIKKNKITHYQDFINKQDRLSDLRIYGIHTLNDSILRFTSHTHGLVDYNLNKHSFKIISVFTDSIQLEKHDGFQLMISPLQTKDNQIVENWYTSLSGIVNYNVTQDSFIYHRNGGEIRIRNAVMDNDSVAWCVTYGQGLFSFDLKTKSFENYRCHSGDDWSHDCLSGGSIQIYNDSTLILDSSDKLYFFNKNDKTFRRFWSFSPYTNWSGITSTMKWIDEELWQASWSSGLYRHFLDDHGVQSVSAIKNIDDIYVDKQNDRIISVSKPDLITIHDKENFEEIRIPKSMLGNDYVEGITSDKRGNYWIVTSTNVLLYNEEKGNFKTPFDHVLGPIKDDLTFRKIASHPNGSIWLSSHDGTIFSFDPITLDYKFYGGSSKESFKLDYQYRARFEQFTEDGYVWFAARDGFIGISPDDEKHKYYKNGVDRHSELPIKIFNPSIALKNGNIYFGTNTHEIYRIDQDSTDGGYADLINIKEQVPELSISDIKADDYGNIWVSTKSGLIKINLESFTTELYGDAHRLYDLDELEIMDGKYPIAISHNDFLIVRPDELKPFSGSANIQLMNVELDAKKLQYNDGRLIKTGDEINLGPKDNFLRIQFNDYNYVSQMPKTYAIKVEGLHEDWIDLKERNEFGFSGLPGGQSSIWVKSKLHFAKEFSDPVKILSIHVTPPLMQRKGFWFFCFGLLVLLFYLGYRYRLSQYKEKQNLIIAFNKQLAETEMKALRAQMNPHFLFNVLNAIKLNVQKDEQENAIDFITDFSKLIRSVLQNSSKKRISLAEDLRTLELYVKIEKKRFSTSFDYEFEVDESIHLESITIPPMLLQPYVENAIWHGILHKTEGKGSIKVHTFKERNKIIVEITDNGIGREKANKLKLKSAQKNKSMGMQITKDRMAISNILSNDQIEVEIIDLYGEDGNSAGTKVVVKLQQNQ